ncbi:Iron only hydrogenase large subunit, C-terminal domain containing protein [Trichomonas vaginalis G3]|uniref:Iron only hydrogenase large subunit, C-terminal domain containing protein n=1 Tax=Trichomonas vaginalis (strain ATCC PRA-98 / G3) TaxID=412133 RepID=A2E4U8_TRIV3|nr:photosystem I iron-sulfur center-related family [Trichomonas vaginalis G3]EAY12287.1 Iron only hydrogenase large subunit, C-terminal domain containing protein [Trichomonas vaginalis G3]KAI5552401.1 photosystem I iron-sulfur center-related family [Trichomonas vaginalis G3]|eukprot:XP_001324510.1 Iron only hydrogenase large subunit, C-terminal domain containing protein [Trichomonas vaginalis G3]
MLSCLSRANSFSRHFEITIDGKKYEAFQGETIQNVCSRNHIQVPRACHSYYYKGDECGLCKVLVNGTSLQNACKTLVYKGLDVKTRSPEVIKNFPEAMKKFKEFDDFKLIGSDIMPHVTATLNNMEQCMANPDKPSNLIDDTAIGLKIDPHKCTKCNKCVPICPSKSLVLAPYIQAFGNNGLVHAFCNNCGKCAEVCDSKAITYTNHVTELGDVLAIKDMKKVAIIDLSVCINLERMLKLPRGSLTVTKLGTALLKGGFDLVFDAAIGSDIAILEEAQILANHVMDRVPLVSAWCLSSYQTILTHMPEAQKILSSVISPPLISGFLTKSAPKTLSVSFTNCIAHKVELAHYNGSHLQYNNMALSVEELANFLEQKKIDLKTIQDKPHQAAASRAGILSSTAEGWTDAIIEVFTRKHLNMTEVKKDIEIFSNLAKIIKIEIKPGTTMRFGIAYGLQGLQQLLSRPYPDLLYICVAECEGGCLNGICGSKGDKLLKENILKDHAHKSPFKSPLDNPLIQRLYKLDFAKPEDVFLWIHNGPFVPPKSLFAQPNQQNQQNQPNQQQKPQQQPPKQPVQQQPQPQRQQPAQQPRNPMSQQQIPRSSKLIMPNSQPTKLIR